jgi:hypothetical protein
LTVDRLFNIIVWPLINDSELFVDMAAPDIQPANNGCPGEEQCGTGGEDSHNYASLSSEPATPDEARQILGLKSLDKVNWQQEAT